MQILPGVWWLRMPMPRGMDCINVWALADGDGWTIVDTGLQTPQTVAAWELARQGIVSPGPIRRVLVTHLHPDHSGMAGWFVRTQGAQLWMSRLEYLMLRALASDTGKEAPPEAIRFYTAAGWTAEALDRYRSRFGAFGAFLHTPPASFRRISNGETIGIGGRRWEVVMGAGHSPEHACLHCPELKLLISGDQVLPGISSNISVHALEPEANPLSDWLGSLPAVAGRVPDDVLVLPAHGEPFVGLHARIRQLVDGHERSLERLHAALAVPRRPVDVFPFLYRRPITPELLGMATGEALAHLSCLRTRGLAQREADAQGVDWWQQAPAA